MELDTIFGSCNIFKRKRVSAFIIDETVIKIGNHHFWLWICIEPVNRTILGMHISNERNMFVAISSPNIVSIQFTQMVVDDIVKHVTFCI